MKTLKLKKIGFTLVEVMLVTSAFAVIVVGIILAINRSFVFIDNTRLSVRAANFAREGMEMVYNLRDTNWRKHSGERDKYWLSVGTGDNLTVFQKGVYALKEGTQDNNKYIYAEQLTSITSDADIVKFYSNDGFWDSGYSAARNVAKLTFDGEYSYYELDDNSNNVEKTGSIQDVLIGQGLEFYRILRVYGVYCKNTDSTELTTGCPNDSDPKEMRFCVKVFYRSTGKHATELCGVITNFKE